MHKTFAAARREDDDAPADTFELYGETFTLRKQVPVTPLLDLAASADGDANELDALRAFTELLRGLVVAEDADRLLEHLRAAEVAYDDLLAVVQWALPVVVGRPTQRRSDSPPPPSLAGMPSSADGSPRVVSLKASGA